MSKSKVGLLVKNTGTIFLVSPIHHGLKTTEIEIGRFSLDQAGFFLNLIYFIVFLFLFILFFFAPNLPQLE